MDRVAAEREGARIAAEQAAAARLAQENRDSLDPQVVAAQATLDAEAALEAYTVAAQAALVAQEAASREPTNDQLREARNAAARISLEAQTNSARAALHAQTRRDFAQRATTQAQHQDAMDELREGHRVEVQGLRAMVGVLCFSGETLISIKDNSSPKGYHSRAISSIRVGDFVVSCNLEVEGGTCEFAQVEDVMENTTDHLIKLSFNGKNVRATDNHPFYVVDKEEWVEAQYLHRGDKLRDISGETVAIEEIQGESGTFNVYNLGVKKHRNYYASDVLVHNCNRLGVPVPDGI